MSEAECEKCGSTNGWKIYCDSSECGCGEVKYFGCRECGHTTPYYHVTKKGKELLRILLENHSSNQKVKKDG